MAKATSTVIRIADTARATLASAATWTIAGRSLTSGSAETTAIEDNSTEGIRAIASCGPGPSMPARRALASPGNRPEHLGFRAVQCAQSLRNLRFWDFSSD